MLVKCPLQLRIVLGAPTASWLNCQHPDMGLA